ncbi:uncharacterized protein [Chelonus insularis]|uniref:uncharacterized protein n=1 Tax=Chelonus insularis TaxID=460826 RepID=UPI00158A7895|nr:uncharacterized protein LOC118066453 [Chelonus insularis]
MKILEDRHLQNYKFILTFLGQWPYQSLFQQKCIRCVIILNVFSILIPKMKTLLYLIEENGDNIRTEKDIKIMQNFLEQGRVTTKIYLSKWYEFPPRLQRLLIPIMMRSIKPCQITAGKFAVMSMDTFSITIKFVNSTDNLDIFFECIPMLCLHYGALFKYMVWVLNFDKIKQLFDHMKEDGKFLTLTKDISIMQSYIGRAYSITTTYTTIMFSILIIYLSSPAVPKILDIIMPLKNGTRNLIYLYQTEYFVDPDEYYVHILIHSYMTVPFTVGILVFFDNLLATYIQHVCGMFMILRPFRTYLETLHLSLGSEETPTEIDKNNVYNRIVQCIFIHRSAITFANTLESWCTRAYMAILMINLFVITLTGMVTLMKLDEFNEAFKFGTFTVGSIFHLYYTCCQGEELIEHSEAIFVASYTSEWYRIPRELQKLLIPIMLRSMTSCKITAGNIAAISMETFSLVLRNSMSFFAVLSSCR